MGSRSTFYEVTITEQSTFVMKYFWLIKHCFRMVFYNNMLLWHRHGIDKQRSRFTFFLWNVSCYWRRVYAVYADVLLTAYWLVDSMGLCVIFRNTNNYLMMATIVWFLIDNLFQYKFNAFNNISVMEETGKTNQPSTWH